MKRSKARPTRSAWLILLLIAVLQAPRCAPRTPPPATPDFIAEHLRAAAIHVDAGAYTAAEAAYREALQAVPNNPQPLLELARLYRRWQRPQAGLAALDEALRLGAAARENGHAGAIAILRLELLAMAGNWSQVAIEATEHLRAYPNDGAALQRLTQAYLQDHECLAATTVAGRWYEAAPDDRDAALTWGLLAGDARLLCETDAHLGEAAFCTTGAERTDPDVDIITALIRSGKWPLTACVLRRALTMTREQSTSTAEMHAWLGEALVRVGRPAEAQPHLVAATNLAPEAPLGWLLLGMYYLGQQETEAAREALLNARSLDPRNPAPYLALAEATAQTGNYKEIEVWIAAALEIAPTDAEIAKAAARFYLERNLIDAVYPLRAIQKAIQLAPDDGETQMLLGRFRLLAGDQSGAVAALDEAVKLDPGLGAAHYLRGLALQATNKPTEAQQAFIRAADLGYFP